MWLFFSLVSCALVGVVAWLLYCYPSGNVSLAVKVILATAWLTSLSMIAFIPVDVWATLDHRDVHPIYVMWQVTYWATQFFTWLGLPLVMAYVDSGSFTIADRTVNSLRDNFYFYSLLFVLSFIGIIFVLAAGDLTLKAIPGTCIALSNMFGLTVVVFLLGYGLVSVPRSAWRLADLQAQLKQKHYDVGKLSLKVQQAIAEVERMNLVVHISSSQISRRDPLKPYMNIICQEFEQTKPSGLELPDRSSLDARVDELTEGERDYALDLQGVTSLRKAVRRSAEKFSAISSEYISHVKHAILLTEICKRRQNRDYAPTGKVEGRLGRSYWYMQCLVAPFFRRAMAVLFGLISVVVVWSELVIVGKREYLSPPNLLMSKAHREWAFYCVVVLPLAYMFFCTYHTLFNLGAFQFYHLIPHASSSYSLLLNGSLMCRFAAPLAYNFLHVIQSEDQSAFSKVMGAMHVLPFFGKQFNSILPILLLIHCLLIYFDVWKKLSEQFIPTRYQFSIDEPTDDHSNAGRQLVISEQEATEMGRPIGSVLGLTEAPPKKTTIPVSTTTASGAARMSSHSLDYPLTHLEDAPTDRENPGREGSTRLDSIFASLTGSNSRRLLPESDSRTPRDKRGWKWLSRS